MARYFVEKLEGMFIDDEFVAFEVGDTILIETNDILIKEAEVTGYYVSHNQSTITVDFSDYQSMEINIDDIIRIEN